MLYELNITEIINTNMLHIVGIINKGVKASEQVNIIISLYVSLSRFLCGFSLITRKVLDSSER